MNSKFSDAISRRPLHSEVADRLRELIINGEIPARERLNERLLSERFNISRTPLREAIKILSLEGLVELLPNRGAVVTELTLREVEELFQVVGSLEALAGELACARATNKDLAEVSALHFEMAEHFQNGDRPEYYRLNQRIHQKIVGCAQNTELAKVYSNLSLRLDRARYMANFSQERWAQAMKEHENILNALQKRDSAALKTILKEHLDHKFAVLKQWLIENGDEGKANANTDTQEQRTFA